MEVTTLLILSCLLLFFTTKPVPGLAGSSAATVLDISGKRLQKGVDYYILPVIRGRGGGLKLANARNKTCPLDVVQDQFEVSNGLPLTFSPMNPRECFVHESTDLNIKFSAAPATTCIQSKVWKLDSYDDSLGQWFVTSGGVEGNPGPQTVSNWFKIEKFNDDYKLVFCPTVCNFCKVICRDVGIFIKDGIRRLALSDQPFIVMFKKA